MNIIKIALGYLEKNKLLHIDMIEPKEEIHVIYCMLIVMEYLYMKKIAILIC